MEDAHPRAEDTHSPDQPDSRGLADAITVVATVGRPETQPAVPLSPLSSNVSWSIRYIVHNHGETFTMGQLAQFAGLSKFHFSRKFHRETGLPPRAFLRRYRIACAMDILEKSRLEVRHVAHRVGYRDHAAFTRAFTRIAGEPPTAYRARCRAARPVGRNAPPSPGE